MSSPTVSVVIPTYNRAAEIGASVASVLGQSFGDFELIVIDDCSEDDTLEVLGRIDDPRLKVLRQDRNSGASVLRSRGVHEATGRFVAFQDSDDEWLLTKLERQLARLYEPGSDFAAAYCGMMVIGHPLERTGARTSVQYVPTVDLTLTEGDIVPTLLRRTLISTQTLIARRDVLLEVGDFDATLPALEDWDYSLRLARGRSIAFVDEPLVVQRFSPNSLTRSWRNRMTARIALTEKHYDLMSAYPGVLDYHFHAIGSGLASLGEWREARKWLARAVRRNPTRVKSWVRMVHAPAADGGRSL